MTAYDELQSRLVAEPRTWLVTGVAGFIGSNLLEALLKLNQRVVGLDNFSTGHQRNLDEIKTLVTPEQWANFQFIHGDICNMDDCGTAMAFTAALAEGVVNAAIQNQPVNFVLHQAALGSVPRSIKDPVSTNSANIVSAQGTTCFRPAGFAWGYRHNQSALMVSINRMVAFGRTV